MVIEVREFLTKYFCTLLFHILTIPKHIYYLDSASKFIKYKESYHLELLEIANKLDKQEVADITRDRLVKYFPFKVIYRLERGKQYYKSKKFKDAKSDLESIIINNKKHAEAHYYLDKTLIALGYDKRGEKELIKASKLGFILKKN